jgi:hypothetical protein
MRLRWLPLLPCFLALCLAPAVPASAAPKRSRKPAKTARTATQPQKSKKRAAKPERTARAKQPKVEVVRQGKTSRLMVGGKLIAIFRTPNNGMPAQERAELAARRLKAAIASGRDGRAIEIKRRGESSAVLVNGGLLMIATPDEAKERNEEADTTAQRWAANLKSVLGGATERIEPPQREKPPRVAAATHREHPVVPPTRTPKPPKTNAVADRTPRVIPILEPDRAGGTNGGPIADAPAAAPLPKDGTLALPIGETKLVAVPGRGALTARVENEQVVAATPVAGRPALEIQGLAAGKTTIRISRGGPESVLTVVVKKGAGKIPAVAMAEVTGDQVPATLVLRAAVERALDSVEREAGSAVSLAGTPRGSTNLASGGTADVVVPVSVSGDGMLSSEGAVRVQVKNRQLPAEVAKLLLYSNDPESVREYGLLYEGLVDSSGPARLLYHHQNRMGRTFTFQVHLLNPGDEPVDVQVIQGDAGPIVDTVLVGHRAAQRFMDAYKRNLGYITRVPAKGSRTLFVAKVPNLETVSGLYNLRILDGGSLVAHVAAAPDAQQPQIKPDDVEAARAEPHMYPSPQRAETYSYTVGDRWTFVPIGRKDPLKALNSNRKLFGNYGVLYNIVVDLNNPTNEERTVRVLMAPEAGWARGVFVIDGQTIEAPQIAPPAEATLWSVKLAPQEQRRVTIQGIPVGGSAYPVSLVVRS